VMHPMQPPKQRHGVEHHVLPIDRQIEQQHRTWDRQPGGDWDNIEEAQPRLWARKAIPTPANGSTRNVFIKTRPKLFGQRRRRLMDCGRRGVKTSHRVISASMPKHQLSRLNDSAASTTLGMGFPGIGLTLAPVVPNIGCYTICEVGSDVKPHGRRHCGVGHWQAWHGACPCKIREIPIGSRVGLS
jgi:hypothetical protein